MANPASTNVPLAIAQLKNNFFGAGKIALPNLTGLNDAGTLHTLVQAMQVADQSENDQTGACQYMVGDQLNCADLTARQCGQIPGSTFSAGTPCSQVRSQ
jgi:hypothetical protein